MTRIDQINNLHWRFPKKKAHVRLETVSDFELEKIRNCVKTHNAKTWFAIPSETWYEEVTYLLKFRKAERDVIKQMKSSRSK